MASYSNPSAKEISTEEDDANAEGDDFDAVTFVQIYALYIFVGVLFLLYLWQRLPHIIVGWGKMREECERRKKRKKEQKESAQENKEEGRLAAVERLQKKYDEDVLKMKKIAEEKEEKKKQKYMSDFPDISPGRKLNESCDHLKGRDKPTYRANRGTDSPGTSGNKRTT